MDKNNPKEKQAANLNELLAQSFQTRPPAMDEEEQDPERRVKLKNFTVQNSTLEEDNVNPYYCSICGALCVISSISIDKFPTRKTDSAIIIDYLNSYCKPYLSQGAKKVLIRSVGGKKSNAWLPTLTYSGIIIEAENQYRYNCQCGILIGYTSISFEEFENLQQLNKKKNKEYELKDVKLTNRHYFYVLSDALVLDPKDCQVIKAVSTHASEIK